MKTPDKIIRETRNAATLVERCGDSLQKTIEIGNLLIQDRTKLDKLVSDLYSVALDLHKSVGDMERENEIDEDDCLVTFEAIKLQGVLNRRRITLIEEYGGRVLHMTLDEAEAFEKSSGYVLEDILPDFMFGEVLGYLRHKGALRETCNT